MSLREITTIPTKVGELQVYQGYDDGLIDQLIDKSKAERLTDPKSVPNDAGRRFVDHDTFHAWRTKGENGRMAFWAVDPSRTRSDGQPELAGLSGLGRQDYPADLYPQLEGVQANHTYLIRSYGLEGALAKDDPDSAFYEGTGMSKRLSQVAIGVYAAEYLLPEAVELADHGMEPAVWAETDKDNPARTGMYPNMFGSGKGLIETGVSYDQEHGLYRACLVVPLSTVVDAGFITPA